MRHHAGISKLEFDRDGVIKSMVSSEGELVPFKKPIDPAKANGAVEKWLAQVISPIFCHSTAFLAHPGRRLLQ